MRPNRASRYTVHHQICTFLIILNAFECYIFRKKFNSSENTESSPNVYLLPVPILKKALVLKIGCGPTKPCYMQMRKCKWEVFSALQYSWLHSFHNAILTHKIVKDINPKFTSVNIYIFPRIMPMVYVIFVSEQREKLPLAFLFLIYSINTTDSLLGLFFLITTTQ